MTSTTGSHAPSREAVRRAAVITHGKSGVIGPALERLETVARGHGVELLLPAEERAKHGRTDGHAALDTADIAVVLGGDGTMLRALNRFLGTGIPVLGVNFGRVGFLCAIRAEEMESGLARAFRGDYAVLELPTLAVDVAGGSRVAVNDVVVRSADVGRMVELAWSIGGEDLGTQPCDGMIVATPAGSTAYNLSNGGPVLVWGLEAMAITFVAPHSLHARPMVVPKGALLEVVNHTTDVGIVVLVDGHAVAELGPDAEVAIRIDDQRASLGILSERSFFRRYRETFAT
ncbi:MAG TPA: NAD(+)/NADH kinase [Gaiellaceae bacterium]|nr:NAD(+)/NADH kinase [Gaiellaceae bacterium]